MKRDIAVVGGGILGLAVARELLRRQPGLSLTLFEREHELARHQTGHNSGVVHAGIYYAPGSLKARLCVEGARELYAFCEERGVAFERCGKLILARSDAELPGLGELERRGRENGVPGLRRLGASELRSVEPHAVGVAALHSPQTGIVDFPGVARALAEDVRAAGGEIVTGRPVGGFDELGARRAVFCAGLEADRLAVAGGAPADPRIIPFRGSYLKLSPERRTLVRGLIYPVPDPTLPFLGVHLTRHVDGEVYLGPSALLAPSARSLAWPGTWRMMARFWRTGARELRLAAGRGAWARAASEYVPGIHASDLSPAFSGVRAQAVGRDGALVDDFVLSRTGQAVHVRNAPSPAATSSLALARHIVDSL